MHLIRLSTVNTRTTYSAKMGKDGKKSSRKSDASASTASLNSKGKQKQAVPQRVDPSALQASSGFLAVPIKLSSKHLEPTPYHWLYLRVHQSSSTSGGAGSSQALPNDRTLFVANLPIDTTERHLRTLFHSAGGTVQQVHFQAAKNVYAEEMARQRARLVARRTKRGDDDESSDEEEKMQDETDAVAQDPRLTAFNTGSGRKKKNGEPEDPLAAVPAITPLPIMDARLRCNPTTGTTQEYLSIPPLLPTASSAHVVFLDASSVSQVLTLAKEGVLTKAGWIDPFIELRNALATSHDSSKEKPSKGRSSNSRQPRDAASAALASGLQIPPVGLDYLLQSYRLTRPSLDAVRKFADSSVARYEYLRSHRDVAVLLEEREAASSVALPTADDEGDASSMAFGMGLPPKSLAVTAANAKKGIQAVSVGPEGELLDQDGFVIVQRGGKYGRTNAGEGQGVGVIRKNAAEVVDIAGTNSKKKKKPLELEDFYRFQRRETKRNELAEMRVQFEKDKEKVRKFKETRRFKPY